MALLGGGGTGGARDGARIPRDAGAGDTWAGRRRAASWRRSRPRTTRSSRRPSSEAGRPAARERRGRRRRRRRRAARRRRGGRGDRQCAHHHAELEELGADTEPSGEYDVILELVGGANLRTNLERLALKGRIAVIGIGAGGVPRSRLRPADADTRPHPRLDAPRAVAGGEGGRRAPARGACGSPACFGARARSGGGDLSARAGGRRRTTTSRQAASSGRSCSSLDRRRTRRSIGNVTEVLQENEEAQRAWDGSSSTASSSFAISWSAAWPLGDGRAGARPAATGRPSRRCRLWVRRHGAPDRGARRSGRLGARRRCRAPVHRDRTGRSARGRRAERALRDDGRASDRVQRDVRLRVLPFRDDVLREPGRSAAQRPPGARARWAALHRRVAPEARQSVDPPRRAGRQAS